MRTGIWQKTPYGHLTKEQFQHLQSLSVQQRKYFLAKVERERKGK